MSHRSRAALPRLALASTVGLSVFLMGGLSTTDPHPGEVRLQLKGTAILKSAGVAPTQGPDATLPPGTEVFGRFDKQDNTWHMRQPGSTREYLAPKEGAAPPPKADAAFTDQVLEFAEASRDAAQKGDAAPKPVGIGCPTNVNIPDLAGLLPDNPPANAVKRRRPSPDSGRAPASSPAGPQTSGGPAQSAPASADAPSASETGSVINIQLPSSSRATSSPADQSAPGALDTITKTTEILDTARGQDLVQAATLARQEVVRSAARDHAQLADTYRNVPNEALPAYLERAKDALGEAAELLGGSSKTDLDSSEKNRFRNFFLNARDKAEIGLGALREEQKAKDQLGEDSPFQGLVRSPTGNPLARNQTMADLFGSQVPADSAAATADALVNRLVMFNGLPPRERERMLSNLKLAEKAKITLPNGKSQVLPILHNGYILGGGSSGLDCSSFVSSVLPADVRKGRFTTLDFRTMWVYRHTGEFPNPPKYPADRAKLVRDASQGFTAINLYAGEPLAVGDLLVYRLLSEPIGHIFVVRGYNPATLQAEVIEAAQSAGTVREREFNLSVDPPGSAIRLVRPGLMALRLKPVTNRACSYKDHVRPQSSSRKGGGA